MTRIAIVTDSTADLSREVLAARGVEVVPFGVRIGQDAFFDRVDIDAEEFMARLSMSAPHPTTFSPIPGAFETVFRRLAADHDVIVAVLLSSKLGGSVRAATIAAEAVKSIVQVDVIDSMNASLGLGFQVLRAADLVQTGLSADDLVTRLNAERTLHHLAFFCDSLEYLQHGGRAGLAASLFGGFLQIKPLLHIEEGQVVPLERTRTRVRALTGLIEFAESFARIDRLGLLYSTELEDADSMRASLADRCQPERVSVAQFSPVLTAHLGPGALGVCVFEGQEPI